MVPLEVSVCASHFARQCLGRRIVETMVLSHTNPKRKKSRRMPSSSANPTTARAMRSSICSTPGPPRSKTSVLRSHTSNQTGLPNRWLAITNASAKLRNPTLRQDNEAAQESKPSYTMLGMPVKGVQVVDRMLDLPYEKLDAQNTRTGPDSSPHRHRMCIVRHPRCQSCACGLRYQIM